MIDDLVVDTDMRLSVSHGTKSSVYALSLSDAVLCRGSWAAIDKSSAHERIVPPGVALGMPCRKRLNSDEDRTAPWGPH